MMNNISYNNLMSLFKEYTDVNDINHTNSRYMLYSELFQNWIENMYGFTVDVGVTNLPIVISDPRKKFIFDIKYDNEYY